MKTHLSLVFLFSLLLLGASSAVGQRRTGTLHVASAKRLTPEESISQETKFVSCWDKSNTFVGSRLVRSPIFVSSDALYAAYVEVEAIAFVPEHKETYGGPLCANTSRLLVSEPGGKAFRLVYLATPERSELGNSMRLIDWSSDGTELLVELTHWQYESEGTYTDFLLFSPKFGVVTKPDLSALLTARFGKDCGTENSVVGFGEHSNVIVAVGPITDDIAKMNGAKSCVEKKTLLSLDLEKGLSDSSQLLPDSFQLHHYGKFQKSGTTTSGRHDNP